MDNMGAEVGGGLGADFPIIVYLTHMSGDSTGEMAGEGRTKDAHCCS